MKLCSVEGCGKKTKGQGYCQGHLVQFKKHGKIIRHVLGMREKKTCCIDDCNEIVKSKGLCRLHYERLKLTGTTDTPLKSLPAIERILRRVTVDENGCWNCSLGKGGEYPQVSIKRKLVQVHRYVYEYFREKIPDGLFGCHKCNNKMCCNPDHIYIATNKQNLDDAVRDGLLDYSSWVGEKSHHHKLTSDDILKIRSDGRKGVELAKLFGVSNSCISQIKRRKNWESVPDCKEECHASS
jgi:hypothetical protein